MKQKREGKQLEEYIIGRWIKALMVALKILFLSERQLCDRLSSRGSLLFCS